MSGIMGWADIHLDLTRHENLIRAMTQTLAHRGPDGVSVWVSPHAALGHCLLGPVSAHAGQPAVAEAQEDFIALCYDGTIVNLDAVRCAAAHAADPAATNAGVLIAAYLRWGARFAERLDGSFAIAVWDGRARRLLLARDRLGVKPLYYFAYPGGVTFASEPKGIMANPRFSARMEISALPVLLQPRLVLPGETPLAGLSEVPSGHVMTWTESGSSLRRYWRLPAAPHEDSPGETASRVRALVGDAVSRVVPPSGPCLSMLSGGVDSTAVSALAARLLAWQNGGRVLETFCVSFDSDEAYFVPSELRPEIDAPYAQTAASFIGSSHVPVPVSVAELARAIPATRGARDLPGWGQFDASMYVLFARMSRRGSVALSGEAADEIFGGYPYLFKPDLVQRDTFPWLGEGPRLADFLAPDVKAVADPREDERARYSQLLSDVPRVPGENGADARMREVLFLGMSGPLAVVLDRMERMSMAHGLEVRLPFCDHRLVEYVWGIPWSMKSAGGLKGLFKTAMADFVPSATLTRPKSAYPHVHSPEFDRALVEETLWILNDPGSPLHGLFDAPRLTCLLRRIEANELTTSLPGGVRGAQLLTQVVEASRWVHDYHVSIS